MNDAESRALESGGTSSTAIYRMAVRTLKEFGPTGGLLVDVGCGKAQLWPHLADSFSDYIGADVIRYQGYPDALKFVKVDLDTGGVPLPAGHADTVASIETIEHLENPRAFFRELVRLVRPGGVVLVTTPNQLSLVSLLCLLGRHHYRFFKEGPGLYPAHITALLELDLIRIAQECGLGDVKIYYSNAIQIPRTVRRLPRFFRGRWFSDNLAIIGRKPPSA
ncbi:class I SAM-dependent methyltransferase [Aquisphaera insulae]|uniref:class I SAM-dependent methyltransferase n=1 Tax=Aquisphaera insulae TaxID=2712864 RepID=UPI0013EB96C2|nr:class I SAM-dependent methyltransferase [Aquisphaera insulae]